MHTRVGFLFGRAVTAAIIICAATVMATAQPVAQNAPDVASADGLWLRISESDVPVMPPTRAWRQPVAFTTYWLDLTTMRNALTAAPPEYSLPVDQSTTVISLPMPDGTYQDFSIFSSPIVTVPHLAKDHLTYCGQGLDDPAATVRLDVTPFGFHGQILTPGVAIYIDPYQNGDADHYISYYRRDLLVVAPAIECHVRESADYIASTSRGTSGDTLHTYVLAVVTTGEYTQFFGGTAAAEAAVITTMNRVTGIYERDFAIRLNLVYILTYDDPATDPFDTSSVNGPLLDAADSVLDSNFGSGNYDVGHLVSASGGGGLAQLGCVCTGDKGRGATALTNPQGDAFDVDYVAHELGHQFGGDHTFNGTVGSCGGGNRVGSSAYEPGSGSTIMAYAGICGFENVQNNSDAHFHTRSIDQITTYRDGGGACAVTTATGNTAPVADAGPDYTIPRETPFRLYGGGTDADGDTLSYCWEQFDLGAASPPPNTVDGPLFRSRPPTTESVRVMPQMVDILANVPTPWERLPAVDRTMTFRCTVRDNRAGGGGVDTDEMVITVAGTPFFVTYPNGGETLIARMPVDVQWTVGGGDVAANVNILLSTDSGQNFDVTLAAGTANDGIESILLPCGETTTARIMVEAADNIFFNVSDSDFSIVNPDPVITCPPDITIECDEPTDPSNTGEATAVDLCDAAPTITFSDVEVDANCPVTSIITRTWVVTNDSGYTDSCDQIITRVDTTPPVFTVCPQDAEFDHGDFICNTDLLDWLNSAEATDNCDPNLPVITHDAPVCGFGSGTTNLVTWTAVDHCGNASTCTATVRVKAATRGGTTEKGSLVVFPKVELRWNQQGDLLQDTIIELSNDWPADTKIVMYFVSETCTWVKNDIVLTMNEPCYWTVSTGRPKGVSPWTVLGNPYPDPDGGTDQVMRGYIVLWAVNAIEREISWNHLSGTATLVNYANDYAWSYSPWTFAASTCVELGEELLDCTDFAPDGACCAATVIPGQLDLDGFQYDLGPRQLVMTFFSSGSQALSLPNDVVVHDTDLTLLVLDMDLRQDSLGPYTTKANFYIWNENEVSFSGQHYCVTKWDQSLLSARGMHFMRIFLHTDLGRARIDGISSIHCPTSDDHVLIGVIAKRMMRASDMLMSGTHLVGLGDEATSIYADYTYNPPPTPVKGNLPTKSIAVPRR